MAQFPNLNVTVSLKNLHCFDEGDGWGTAEPYLWSIFYKIDGSNMTQSANKLFLRGHADFFFSTGSHGNLNNRDVDEGDDVNIPGSAGTWNTELIPIQLSKPDGQKFQFQGIIGGACVLMEEDGISDHDIEAGHRRLNDFVVGKLNDVLASIPLLQFVSGDTLDEAAVQAFFSGVIDDISTNAESEVEAGVKDELNIFQAFWAFFDSDDVIGKFFFKTDTKELQDNGLRKNISQRWENEGDWEITGDITATVIRKEIPINVIPDTRRLKVSCIEYHHTKNSGFIEKIGGIDNQVPWKITREFAIELIEQNRREFFVGDSSGDEANVFVVNPTDGRFKYITTVADDTTADNLLSLPTCPKFMD